MKKEILTLMLMKKGFIILTFLILFLPMWKACDTKRVPHKEIPVEVSETKTAIEKIKQLNIRFLSIFIFDDNEIIVSGYQITWTFIECIKDDGLEIKDLADIGMWACFSFSLYILISIILVIFVFIKKKKRPFLWFSAINLCVIIFSYFLFLCISEDIYDIKYGFYLLIINSLLIFYNNFRTKNQSLIINH
jgi:hypothetical protein